MKTLLGALVLVFGMPSWALSTGVATRTPVDANSIGCGIIKGRLLYLAKTHEEVDDQIPRADNKYDAKLLEILAKRYPHTFQEDRGYDLKVVWDLETEIVNTKQFDLSFPGMKWTTTEGQMPEDTILSLEEGKLKLTTRISTLDYCLGSNQLILRISGENQSEEKELRASWKPELTL